MRSSCNGTWEGLALVQRTLGRLKQKNGTPFGMLPCAQSFAGTSLGTRQTLAFLCIVVKVRQITASIHLDRKRQCRAILKFLEI